jgi:hypothetical protein
MSLSESLIASNDAKIDDAFNEELDVIPEQTISAFTSSATIMSHESEIEEFDAI